MTEVEVPQFFVCPISLQIMKDPVATITGITYERESIEHWLQKAKDCMCPVTKQSLPRNSEFLTPNHTLRRLIQSWYSSNESNVNDKISSPTFPLEKIHVKKLVVDLEVPCYFEKAMKKMHGLAIESERNRQCMVEAGVVNAMVHVIAKSFKQGRTRCLEEALIILRLLWNSAAMVNNMKHLVGENFDFINSLIWILQLHKVDNNIKMVNEVMPILKSTIEVANSTIVGNLKLDFFIEIVSVIENNRALSLQAIKSALHVLIETCPLGRNRVKIVEAGAVMEIVELALDQEQEKNITELMFILLAHLCSCADGREQFIHHAASIAMLSKRILRVSSTTDDQALRIFTLISKFSASNEVVKEMLRVGAVAKLCMVMQADCASYLKEQARGILRLHSKAWNNSPCIQMYLLTRHQR
ncbi:unnamed protein product [Lupinus luteus]|uniref:U-box domain-containing protein n=1 Tax=Lupinus luteus TaxID=3873 RepID=A0AAV1YDP8_LUPLU